jgi:tetratricopeptide (TPR) repeat protein
MTTIEALLVEAYSSWDDATVLSRTGRELQDRNRLGPACEILERAVEIRPAGEPDDWAYLAFAHMRGFRHREGLEAIRRGIEATDADALRSLLAGYSDDEAEKEALNEALADSDDPAVVTGRISRRFYAGEHADALAEMRGLHEASPEDEEIGASLCWMLMGGLRMGVVEESDLRELSLPYLDRRIAAEPARSGPVMMKLMALDAMRDWEGILELTAAGLERFPDEETLMQFRGRALRETGDLDHAVAYLNRAIGAKPSFAGARIDLGKTYEALEKHDLAEEVFREIPVANPDYSPGPISLALFLSRRERWEEAEEVFLDAWPKLPSWVRGSINGNPDAQPLLERVAVKAIMEADSVELSEGQAG